MISPIRGRAGRARGASAPSTSLLNIHNTAGSALRPVDFRTSVAARRAGASSGGLLAWREKKGDLHCGNGWATVFPTVSIYTRGLQVPSKKVFEVGARRVQRPSEEVLGALGTYFLVAFQGFRFGSGIFGVHRTNTYCTSLTP